MSILGSEPPSIRQVLPECPVALERVVSKSLRKNENERYTSMEALLKDVENLNFSLIGEGSKGVAQTPGAKTNVQPAPTALLASYPISPAVHPAGAAPIGTPVARQPVKTILKQPPRPTSRPWRNAAAACVLLAVIVLGAIGIARRDNALGIARRYKMLAYAIHPDSAQNGNVAAPTSATAPLPGATPETPTPAPVAAVQTLTPTEPGAPGTPTADVATPTAASGPVLKLAPSSLPSIEDQQRYLLDLAHEAADRQDYKGALEQLDEAAKLNGPLNDAIADLRRQFRAQSHDAELERVAREEQTLWDKAMAYLNAGDLDDAEESLREILTLPEGGRRWSEATRYVDQVIPERRQEEQLWAAAQQESSSRDPGHFLTEIKALDDVLAAGGRHEQGARQKRDASITNLIREDAERNGIPAPVISNADQWQVTRLKNHFDELVEKGDAGALNQLQQLQSEFKSLAEAQGPLALEAPDYLNNVIPKAQRHIEDRLAVAKSNSPPNTAYKDAVKAYDRAVAAQNTSMLRDKVLPLFREIAQSGGVRAKEAQRYVDVLIPAALKKSGQQDE